MEKPIWVYFAGKVGVRDWRHALVPGLRESQGVAAAPIRCDGFIYCGPFFISCDHGCAHGPGTHGLGPTCAGEMSPPRWLVPRLCYRWLGRADLVFAWIDDPTCYGTLVEAGWAQAMGKPLYVGFASEDLAQQMWFAGGGARMGSGVHATAEDALRCALLYGNLERR